MGFAGEGKVLDAMNSLIPSETVDVASLGRLFDNTTNSYKLLFFQGILRLIERSDNFDTRLILQFSDVAEEMLAIGWYPYKFFNLSFGVQDKTGEVLAALDFSVSEAAITNPSTRSSLLSAIRAQRHAIGMDRLLEYVPYRLLQPFFVRELAGKPDYKKNELTIELSNALFDERKPLYRINEQAPRSLEFHPDWISYIRTAFPIVRGWVAYHWINYLQQRNANIPAISNKIAPPLVRSSLTKQSSYWREIMRAAPVKCIYSGEILSPEDFSLDHFLPWSFVCHDQLWNLVPVVPEANSSKGNALPDRKYVDCFINLQTQGLQVAAALLGPRSWRKYTEDFVSDLRIPFSDLLVAESVSQGYMATLPSMLSLAKQVGFEPGWVYSSKA